MKSFRKVAVKLAPISAQCWKNYNKVQLWQLGESHDVINYSSLLTSFVDLHYFIFQFSGNCALPAAAFNEMAVAPLILHQKQDGKVHGN